MDVGICLVLTCSTSSRFVRSFYWNSGRSDASVCARTA